MTISVNVSVACTRTGSSPSSIRPATAVNACCSASLFANLNPDLTTVPSTSLAIPRMYGSGAANSGKTFCRRNCYMFALKSG